MWKAILCALGYHGASLVSVARRRDRYVALCEHCGCPLIRSDNGRWHEAGPI